VKNEDTSRDGSVSGLLLYARTDSEEQPDLDVVVQGNRIAARTLDLNEPWQHLRDQLEGVVRQWLQN
jgi:5-methylcytosine-specific restriction enzyme subunit McrC